jgi:hypothetical protein
VRIWTSQTKRRHRQKSKPLIYKAILTGTTIAIEEERAVLPTGAAARTKRRRNPAACIQLFEW